MSSIRIAPLVRMQGKYDEAKAHYELSLTIQESALGDHHPDVATSLDDLAELLRATVT